MSQSDDDAKQDSSKRQCIRQAMGALDDVKETIGSGAYDKIARGLMEVHNDDTSLFTIHYVHRKPFWDRESERLDYGQTVRKSIVPLTAEERVGIATGYYVHSTVWQSVAWKDGVDLPHLDYMGVHCGSEGESDPLPEIVIMLSLEPYRGC